jgi:hypothetical protein
VENGNGRLKNRLQGGEIGVDIRKNEQAHNVASLESVVCMGRVSSFFLGGVAMGGWPYGAGRLWGMAIRGGTAVGGWPYGTLRQQGGRNRNALPLRSERSSTKLENTSLSTGVPLGFLYAASLLPPLQNGNHCGNPD